MSRGSAAVVVFFLVASGCSFIVQFDPNQQPCDNAGECALGFTCVNKLCTFTDGGVADAGTDAGACAMRETNCGDGLDEDCDGQKDCADTDCNALACNDGDACTVGDVCSAGVCQRGTPKQCTVAPSPCQAMLGSCEAGTGRCVHAPLADGTSCGTRASDRCCGGTCVNTTLVTNHCGGCGLACANGQVCQSINQSSCMMEPIDTSGRCSCGPGAPCPMGQTCGTSGYCVPMASTQCAPGQVMTMMAGCQAYCRY